MVADTVAMARLAMVDMARATEVAMEATEAAMEAMVDMEDMGRATVEAMAAMEAAMEATEMATAMVDMAAMARDI